MTHAQKIPIQNVIRALKILAIGLEEGTIELTDVMINEKNDESFLLTLRAVNLQEPADDS